MKMICILIATLVAQGAFASGGFECFADDETVKFSISGGTSRGMGGAIFQAKGELSYKPTDGQPPIAKFLFEKKHIVQYWSARKAFNLLVYSEDYKSKNTYSTQVLIQTSEGSEEGSLVGTYEITTNQMVGKKPADHSVSGPVTCYVE